MTCPICSDRGLLIQDWTDAPPDFAICCCPAAAWYRSDANAGKQTGYFGWQVWCAVQQVDPERVFRLEEIYSAAELAKVGLSVPGQGGTGSREAALLAAGRR